MDCDGYIDWSDVNCMYMFKNVPPTLGELMEDGFDPFDIEDWDTLGWYQTEEEMDSDPFTSDQMERFKVKFLRRYKPRVLGLMPPNVWRNELERMLGEVLPKYRVLYAKLDQGADPMASSDYYGKNRTVHSSFPATQLNTRVEDYASSADDHEFETFTVDDFMSKVVQLQEAYQDADVLLLDTLESLFDCMVPIDDDWYEWPRDPRCMHS